MVLVRHDAKIEITVHSQLWRETTVDVIEASDLDAQLMLIAYMHGMVSGLSAGIKPDVSIRLIDPSDVLAPGQLCPCPRCEASDQAGNNTRTHAQGGSHEPADHLAG